MKFKVRDVVKVVKEDRCAFNYKNGDIGCITLVEDKYNTYWVTFNSGIEGRVWDREIELYKEKEMTKKRLKEMCEGGECIVPIELRSGKMSIAFIDSDGTLFVEGTNSYYNDLMYLPDAKSQYDVMKVFAPIRLNAETQIWEREDEQKKAIINEIKEAEQKLKEARSKLENYNK